MPLGPRPEPPPLPRKEQAPSTGHLPYPVPPQPTLPPKVGLDKITIPYPSTDTTIMSSPIAQMTPIHHPRLKGPRPLGAPLLSPTSGCSPAPPLPYPINTEPIPVLRPQTPQNPPLLPATYPKDTIRPYMPNSPSPTRSTPSYNSGSFSPARPLAMPEPDLVNSPSWSNSPTNPNRFRDLLPRDNFSKTSLDSYFPSPASQKSFYPLNFNSSSNTLNSTAPSIPSVPIIVPPPITGQEKLRTRSIFQWGIPVELLPPMPVPVNSMSGLVMGDKGQLTMDLDLPESHGLARSKFSVEQITVGDLQRVSELWSLSELARWIYELVVSIDAEFSIGDIRQLLTRLFMFRTENLKWDHAETLASSTVASLYHQKFILCAPSSPDTTLLHLSSLGPTVSGVLTELTGNEGQCYVTTPHDSAGQFSCYSSRCKQRINTRALPLLQLPASGNLLRVPSTGGTTVLSSVYSVHSSVIAVEPAHPAGTSSLVGIDAALSPENSLEMNWRRFWHLEESDLQGIDPKIVKLQFAIHELIVSEISFIRDLITYQDVYGEIELMRGLSVMSQQEEFCTRVYGRIRAILDQNKSLLTKLLTRQASQGPYIYDVGDLITQWAQDPKTVEAYTEYANDYLWSDHHLRQELTQSTRLQHWMEERARDPRIMGRPHSFFFHRVLPRLARYQLLLNTILKFISEDMVSEYRSVETAIKTSTKLAQLCDDRVAKQKRVMDVQNLKAHIVFKSTAVTADLKLGDKRRKLLRRGDMVRRGDMKMDWVDTHMLLLDNFMVLSKTREGANGTAFYVTKAPIPLDLLVLESDSEEGVVKMASRLTLTRHGPVEEESSLADGEKSSVLYPMRITHLGSNGQKYLLYLPTRPERTHWSRAIQDAKQSRAHLAFARSAEPFSFKQIADCFGYPESDIPVLPVPIADTPLHRAVTSTTTETASRTTLKRSVNCLIAIGDIYLLGTDFGLWLGGGTIWKQALETPQKIIKIEVLENMNILFVLCGDHQLSWYPLDQIVARGMGDSRRVLGVRLNRQRKVIDFSVAFHLGRVVLFYLQQGGILKLVEPIRSHGVMAMQAIEKIGIDRPSSCIDSFREVDRIHTPSDVTRITPMTKCVILSTSKHFEWTTIATKRAVRLPVGTAATKEMQYYGRPLRMIKLDANHFLKCFESCYVICDHEGRDCIQPTTWFLEKAADCAFYSPYLILFSQGGEMVEIRYVEEFPGRLVQIVTGKSIKLLSNGDESVYLRMAHPWISGRQLILQLMGNEIVKENTSTWYSSSA